ncbi:hypothetical protein NPIL_676751 [Nephila pilipes]|uniref:Uncharacterized protein n=1 Tax=Nephila pilipes TaxID=299642 RepID=A0A8X6T1F7_NEPPI|nr:hypothetical protein NPIL_676751 [Nephila pilipes]
MTLWRARRPKTSKNERAKLIYIPLFQRFKKPRPARISSHAFNKFHRSRPIFPRNVSTVHPSRHREKEFKVLLQHNPSSQCPPPSRSPRIKHATVPFTLQNDK